MFTQYNQRIYTPTPNAGHYVRHAGGWSRVPTEVSEKLLAWNADAALYSMDGPLKGYMYNQQDEVRIEGERFIYEVRMCWGVAKVHMAKLHYPNGSWAEVRNSARPRDDGLWCAMDGRFSVFAKDK